VSCPSVRQSVCPGQRARQHISGGRCALSAARAAAGHAGRVNFCPTVSRSDILIVTAYRILSPPLLGTGTVLTRVCLSVCLLAGYLKVMIGIFNEIRLLG